MLYMLDTDTSSYVIRGGYTSLERHLATTRQTDRCISAMTRAELLYGLKVRPESYYLHTMVRRFLDATRALAWDADAADFHAEIRYQLRAAGTPIGEMDTLIAAHALAADAVLVTNNTRHFETIKLPLLLENWMQ
jgi:tRNA(fMet)-specific endonuclease VapC